MTALLDAHKLNLAAPGGRPLFRDLSLTLEPGDRVALVGRNGVGKSTLLQVLAGASDPDGGLVTCHGTRMLVPQLLESAPPGASPGEHRRKRLAQAFAKEPALLLLDEPTHDLDAAGIAWLVASLSELRSSVVVVSHDRRILRAFNDFFITAESGCHHFNGSFTELMRALEQTRHAEERRYVRELARLVTLERRSDTDRRRRQRKKNLGRIHELERCTSRAVLNASRGYAQESQGKRSVLRKARITAAREWAEASRRALAVELPLAQVLPSLPKPASPVATLEGVVVELDGRCLFGPLDLTLARGTLAVTGPNGSGKTTLLETLVGQRKATRGRAWCDAAHTGYIAQDAANWQLDVSLAEHLVDPRVPGSADAAARILGAHRFPFALAQRPLRSLSPGERLRAALICLCHRDPPPELLVLDEPTDHLDLTGAAALETLLAAWPGSLVIASHDSDFLQAIGVTEHLELIDSRPCR